MYLVTAKPKRAGLHFNHYTNEEEGTTHTMVRLYNTHIIIADNDQIKLNTDDWKTRHTKTCMNDFLNPVGMNVFQKKGDWFVTLKDKSVIEFKDNMVITLGE